MASSRIVYDKTTKMGAKLALWTQIGVQDRQLLSELSRQMEAYVDDNTSLAADLGIAAGQFASVTLAAQDLRTRVFNAAAESTGSVVSTITSGTHGPLKDLLDFTG